jgi:thiol-disulfide isomerase/thioredoxin
MTSKVLNKEIKDIGNLNLEGRKENNHFFNNSKNVKELSPNDFDGYKLADNGVKKTLVYFYAPWCGYCKRSKDLINEFANMAQFIKVAGFNCELYKDYLTKINEDYIREYGNKFVPSYPTIKLYTSDGGSNEIKTFEGERTLRNLFNFTID